MQLLLVNWKKEQTVGPAGQKGTEGLAGQEEAKGPAGQEEVDGQATLLIMLPCERLKPVKN